jgi:hypothetical protein
MISSDNLGEVQAALCVVPIQILWEAIAAVARASYSQDLFGLDLA